MGTLVGAFISLVAVGAVMISATSEHLGVVSTAGSVRTVLGTVDFLLKSSTEKIIFMKNNI